MKRMIIVLGILMLFMSSYPIITADDIDTGEDGLMLSTYQQKLIIDGDEIFYGVAEVDTQDIGFIKSSDNGATWSNSEIAGDTGLADTTSYAQIRPTITVDSNGTLHAVWSGRHAGSVAYWQIRYANSTDGGSSWSQAINLTSGSYHQERPDISINSNDDIQVVWIGKHAGSTTYYQVRYMNSTDNGDTWSSIVNITNDTDNSCYYTNVEVNSNNVVHVFWQSGTDNIATSKHDGSGWSAQVNITSSAYTQYGPSVVFDSSGTAHVCWDGEHAGSTDTAEIRYANSTDGGDTWTEAINITSNANDQYDPSLTIDKSDNLYVIWSDDNGDTSYLKYSSNTGSGWNTPATLPTTGNYQYFPNTLWSEHPSNQCVPYIGFCLLYETDTYDPLVENIYFYKTDDFEMSYKPDVYVDNDAPDSWYNATQVKTVQEGINNVSAGGTVYVWSGTYTENVVVTKSVDVIGNGTGDSFVNTPGSSHNGIFNITSNWVNISNIYFSGETNANTYGMNITGNNVTIFDCVIANCSNNGINISSNYDIDIINVSIIYCSLASGYSGLRANVVTNLLVDNCLLNHIYRSPFGSVGSSAFGITPTGCNNILINNTHFSNIKSHLSYSYGLNGYLVSNITIRNCNYTEGQIGVYVGYSDNITIEDTDFINHIRGTGLGEPFIKIIECFDLLIDNNTCDNNDHYAGFIFTDIAEFTVSNNLVENIEDDCSGMMFNAISWDWSTSTYNKNGLIFDNRIENCTDDGLVLSDYNNVTIYDNYILTCGDESGEYGFNTGSTGEITFYNNYLDNTYNVDSSATNAVWNISKTLGTNIIGGEYLGGNYWSDYTGSDTDGDGLGDTDLPYQGSTSISSGGDYHPLVYTLRARFYYTPLDPIVDEKVSFIDTSLGNIVEWHWTFGDGDTSVGKNQEHTYDDPETYKVTLKVTSNLGATDSTFKHVTVTEKKFSIIFPFPGTLGPYTVPEMYQLLRTDKLPRSENKIKIIYLDTGYTPRSYNGTDLSIIKGFYHPDYKTPLDGHGHGTWISYCFAYLKQIRLPNMEIISYKVFSDDGFCTEQQLTEAFNWVKEQNPDILSFSGGGIGNPNDAFSKKVEELRNQGILVIAAAGNSGPKAGTILSPACSRGSLAIGAVDPMRTILNRQDDIVTEWSSRGPVPGVKPKPDYTAPGESIIGPWKNEERVVSGTSMAAPLVAGGIAVAYADNMVLLNIVDLLYIWDFGIKPGIVQDSAESTVFIKTPSTSYGYGIPDCEKLGNAIFWTCIFLIVLWVVVFCIIVCAAVYAYKKFKKKDKKKKQRKGVSAGW